MGWFFQALPLAASGSPAKVDAWNIGDKSADIALSNGDKTATTTTSATVGVRSTKVRTNGTAGKWYAEFSLGSTAATRLGVANMTGAVSSPAVGTTPIAYILTSSGVVVTSGGNVGNLSALTTGDVVSLAWDTGTEKIWFRKNSGNWNNDAAANPATGTNGFSVSDAASVDHALWMQLTGTLGGVATIRTKIAEFTQVVPIGFMSWMAEPTDAWTPALVGSDLIAWYDFNDPATVIQSGGFLTQWQDKSGNARHANPTNTSMVAVNADGLYIDNAALGGASIQMPTLPSAYFDFAFAGKPNPAGSYRTLIDNYLGGQVHVLLNTGTDNLGSYTGTGFFQAGALTWPSVNGQIYFSASSASTVKIGKDGGTLADETGENLVPDANPCLMNYGNAGAGGGAQGFGTGREFVFMTVGRSQDIQDKVSGYLAWKWDGILGVTTHVAALPSGHPYKATWPTATAPPGVADAWNTNDKSADITLSGSDKIFTNSATSVTGVRTTAAHPNGTAGKFYAEFVCGADLAQRFGISPVSNALTDAALTAYVDEWGAIQVNGAASGASIAGPDAGSVISLAWDTGLEKIWFRKNFGNWNSNSANQPATGAGGTDASVLPSFSYALWGGTPATAGTKSGTIRTEAAEYTQAVPDGFKSWMGETLDAWNALDKQPSTTLSNNDKTFTTGNFTTDGVRSSITHRNGDVGKYYYEVLIGSSPPNYIGIAPLGNPFGTGNLCAMVDNGLVYVNNVSSGVNVGAHAAGDVISVAWDSSASKIWFRRNSGNWNNSVGAIPDTGTGGISCAALSATAQYAIWGGTAPSASGKSATICTEAAELTLGAPTGFKSWMGEDIPTRVVLNGQAATALTYSVNAGQPVLDAWSTLDKSTPVVLSNGDRTALASAGETVRTTQENNATDKYYVEFLLHSLLYGGSVGNIRTSYPLDTSLGSLGIATYGDGLTYSLGVNVGTISGGYAVNDVVCFAFDFINKKVWLRKNGGNWNNSATANPSTNTEGWNYNISASSKLALYAATTTTVTVRTRLAQYTYPVPATYKSWMAEQPSTADAWDYNDKSAVITLSNSDKTATLTGSPTGAVRSTQGRTQNTTGKWYAECVVGGDNQSHFGIKSNGSDLSDFNAGTAHVHHLTGLISLGGSSYVFVGVFAAGDVSCVAWNTGTRQIWLRKNGGLWNNSVGAFPESNNGGYGTNGLPAGLYDLCFTSLSSAGTAAGTVRNKASEFTYAVPPDFNSWMGETFDAWNTLEKTSEVVLSDADKTATVPTLSTLQYVRSTKRQAQSGKFYAEIVVTNRVAGGPAVGNIAVSFALAGYQLYDKGVAINSSGSFYVRNSYVTAFPALSDGDVVCLAFDFITQKVWARINNGVWNNTSGHDPATALGGISYTPPAGDTALSSQFTQALESTTIRTKAAEYTMLPPSGFKSWMGETIPTYVPVTGQSVTTDVGSVLAGMVVADAWSAVERGSTASLSNGDRTVTSSDSSENQIRSTKKNQPVGKFYAEFVVHSYDTTEMGVIQTNKVLTTSSYIDTYGACVYNGLAIYVLGTSLGSVIQMVDGDILCMAVDYNAKKIWFRSNATDWNSSPTANPATGAGGFNYPVEPIGDSALAWQSYASASRSATIRTRQAQYTQTAPLGYFSWMGENLGSVTVSVTGQTLYAMSYRVNAGQPVLDAWNTLDKSPDIVLIDVDKTAYFQTGQTSIRTTRRNSPTEKYYAEFLMTFATGALVGLVRTDVNVDQHIYGYGVGVYAADGSVLVNGGAMGIYLGGFVNGDVVRLAIDFNADKIWFAKNGGAWNGSGSENPETATGSVPYDNTLLTQSLFSNSIFGSPVTTVRTELAEYTYPVPNGFKSWMGENPPVFVSATGSGVAVSVGDETISIKASPVISSVPGLAASVGTATATGGGNIDVGIVGNYVTPSVGTATALGRANINTTVTTNLITASVGDETVSGKANVTVATNLITASMTAVSVSAGGSITVPVLGSPMTAFAGDVTTTNYVSSLVATNVVTASVGTVTVTGKVNVTVATNLATVGLGNETATGKANVTVSTTPGLAASVGTATAVGKIYVSAAVTTNLATASVGTATIVGKANVTTTGQSVAASSGTVTTKLGMGVSPSGASATVYTGTIIAGLSSTVFPVGQQATAYVGTVDAALTANADVTGQEMAVELGQADAGISVTVPVAVEQMIASIGQAVGSIPVTHGVAGTQMNVFVWDVSISYGVNYELLSPGMTAYAGHANSPNWGWPEDEKRENWVPPEEGGSENWIPVPGSEKQWHRPVSTPGEGWSKPTRQPDEWH